MLRAYAETDYRVAGDPPFVLRVGQRCPALIEAHTAHGVSCSAFLTAWNPCSTTTSIDENNRRQHALTQEVRSRGLAMEVGVGQHPTNGWPGEVSVLVYGLSRDAASQLAARFAQHAFVWTGPDGVPELVVLE